MNISYEKNQQNFSNKGIYEGYFTEVPVRASLFEKAMDRLYGMLVLLFSFLCSVKVRRILRASLTVACLVGILCLVAAMEAGSLGLLPGVLCGVALTVAEFFCLRSASVRGNKER